jgi:bifunctional lysine-specific demethylase and histidyl-hydroxylase NO66
LSALELLSGDAQTFLAKVWASRTHVHHTEPGPLVDLLSFDDVDRLLTSTAIRTPAVRVAQDGSVLPASAYTRHATLAGQAMTGLLDPGKVFDLFDAGATVVLQGLHRYWEPLGALVAELELELGHPCQANAYLTPPGNQGFAVHSDSHDVFVFQTHGSKVWEVHEKAQEGEEAEQHTVVLEPGVSMYLPTGTPHAARAQDTVSLHVTLGINQVTWKDVLDRALAGTLDAEAEHLPAGYLDDPALLADGLADRLEALAAGLRGLDPAAVAEAEVHRFLTGRTLWQRGGLRDRIAARGLTDDTRLRRRAGHPCLLRREGERLRVLLGDRELRVPAHLEAALAVVRDAGPGRTLTPADLDLDEQSRLVLCRRLVREGLLEVVA